MADAIEYVPMRHSKWWPTLTNLANCGTFTSVLTWNEPYMDGPDDPTPQQAVTGGQYQDIVDAATLYGAPGTRVGSPTFRGTNEMDPYHAWTLGYGLSGSAAARTNDLDGDGLENVYEFALGGSPIDGHDTSHPQSWSRRAGNLVYVYPRRLDAGPTYSLETSTALVTGAWNSSGYSELPATGPIDLAFESVTNLVPAAVDAGFIRLRIE